jgi:hypothetical protein
MHGIMDWDVDGNITLSEFYQLGDDPARLHMLRKIVGGVSDAGGDGAADNKLRCVEVRPPTDVLGAWCVCVRQTGVRVLAVQVPKLLLAVLELVTELIDIQVRPALCRTNRLLTRGGAGPPRR